MAFSVILTEKGGETQRLDFESDEITIGRVDENDICLPKGNISKKHTKIVVKDGKIIVLDLKSTNGTYVNGKKLAGPQVVTPDDKIYIGDFILNVEPPAGELPLEELPPEEAPQEEQPPEEPPQEPVDEAPPEEHLEELPPEEPPAEEPPPEPEPIEEPPPPPPPPPKLPPKAAPLGKKPPLAAPAPAAAKLTAPGKPAPKAPPSKPAPVKPLQIRPSSPMEEYGQILAVVHDRLIEALDLRRLDLDALGSEELWKKTEATIRAIVSKMDSTGELDAHTDREELIADVLNEALGLGPLEIYLADESVSEIMVNSPSQVYVERNGKMARVDKAFSSNEAVLAVIERIVAPLGRRIDESSPPWSTRACATARASTPSSRRWRSTGPTSPSASSARARCTMQDLIRFGTHHAADGRVPRDLRPKCGATSSSPAAPARERPRCSTSSAASSRDDERIITIEDAAELQLTQDHVDPLETRPANIEGKGEITIRDLVRTRCACGPTASSSASAAAARRSTCSRR